MAAPLRRRAPAARVPAGVGGVAARRGPAGEQEEGPPPLDGRRTAGQDLPPPQTRRDRNSVPQVEADAPNVVWAIDFQFDSTVEGKAIKIASMIDEHTRQSMLHIVERSITAGRLVTHLQQAFDRCWRPAPRCYAWTTDPEFISEALQQFLPQQGRPDLHPAGHTVEQRAHRIVQQPAPKGVLEPQPLDQPARGPSRYRRLQGRPQPTAPPLRAGLPHPRRVRCPMHPHPPAGGL